MAVKCPSCKEKIFGSKKEGETFVCYKCGTKSIIKNGMPVSITETLKT